MNELLKSLSDAINNLNGGAKSAAEALARIAPDAWHALVWRVQVEAITTIVALVVVAVASAFYARKLLRYSRTDEAAGNGDEVPVAVAGAVIVFVCVVLIVALVSQIPNLFAPEVAAAERLMQMVKP